MKYKRPLLFICIILCINNFIGIECLHGQYCDSFQVRKTKKVHIVVHFVNTGQGLGNFQKKKNKSKINGKKWAKKVIKMANKQMKNMHRNWQSPKDALFIKNAKIKLKLVKVNYIHDDSLYRIDSYKERASTSLNKKYGYKLEKCINVYFFEDSFLKGGGMANPSRKEEKVFVKMYNDGWKKYNEYKDNQWVIREEASLLIHELGHIFGLHHDWLKYDNAEDTNPYKAKSCADHKNNWINCSNNFMTTPQKYSSLEGNFTNCQLEIIHEYLSGIGKRYVK